MCPDRPVSEQTVFAALKKNLSDSWMVFHAFDFVARNGQNQRREGRNCGHIHVGTGAPELCPVCKHPQAYFEIEAKNY